MFTFPAIFLCTLHVPHVDDVSSFSWRLRYRNHCFGQTFININVAQPLETAPIANHRIHHCSPSPIMNNVIHSVADYTLVIVPMQGLQWYPLNLTRRLRWTNTKSVKINQTLKMICDSIHLIVDVDCRLTLPQAWIICLLLCLNDCQC